MPVKINFSSVVLFTLFVGFMIQVFRDPVHPGLWLILAIFVGFALFAQILVMLGIMQITPVNQMPRTTNNSTPIDYGNYHYRSIIAKIHSSGVTATTVEGAIKTYSSLFNVGEKAAKPFFHNQFVMSTLGLSIQDTAQVGYQSEHSNQKTEKVESNFWGNISDGVAKNEAKSDEICADPNCSKSVSAFDFRCYQCRGRFCDSCKGSGLNCPSCS
tara:strand:- start:889 stop:1530 length:642 start_codon:yes stop_codon:yes gene_type:complete